MEEICSYIRSNFESVMFCVPMKNSVFYFVPLRSTLGNMKFLILIQYFNQSVCVILYYETDFMGISRRDWGPRPSYLAIVLNCFKCKGVWGEGQIRFSAKNKCSSPSLYRKPGSSSEMFVPRRGIPITQFIGSIK